MTTVVLSIIAIAVGLTGLMLCAWWVRRNGGTQLYIVPVATWLAHSLLFHSYVTVYKLTGGGIWFDPIMVNIWSLVLQLQMLLTIVGTLIIALRERSHGDQLDNHSDSLDSCIRDRLAWAMGTKASAQEGQG